MGVVIYVDDLKEQMRSMNEHLYQEISNKYGLVASLENYVADVQLAGAAFTASKLYIEQTTIEWIHGYIAAIESYIEANNKTTEALENHFGSGINNLDQDKLNDELSEINERINWLKYMIAASPLLGIQICSSLYISKKWLEDKLERIDEFLDATMQLHQEPNHRLYEVGENADKINQNKGVEMFQLTWNYTTPVTQLDFRKELKIRGLELEKVYEDLANMTTTEEKEAYKKSLTIELDEDGWNTIEELLRTEEADDITDSQYLSLVYAANQMTMEEFEQFTNLAYKDNHLLRTSNLSPIYIEFANRYEAIAYTDIAFLYAGYLPESYEEQVNEQGSKSIIATIISRNNLVSYHQNISILEWKGKGSYSVEHQATMKGTTNKIISEFKISPWKSPYGIDAYGDEIVKDWMLGTIKSSATIVTDTLAGTLTIEALGKMVKGLGGTLGNLMLGHELTMGFIEGETYKQSVDTNVSILELGNKAKPLGLHGSLVLSTALSISKSEIFFPIVDLRDTLVCVTVYNKAHPEELITTDVYQGLYQVGSKQGKDLEKLTKWYGLEEGVDDVIEYNKILFKTINKYNELNPSFPKIEIEKLSIEKLSEFINAVEGEMKLEDIDPNIFNDEMD